MKKELLKEYCDGEFENIALILKEIKELREKTSAPNKVEVAALGTFIHNFYNGAENILKRVFQHNNIIFKNTPTYHKFILKKALEENIIDENTYNNLYKFLTFRHFFVHGYSFLIEWEKLKPLVDCIEDIFKSFKTAIDNYIN